MFVRSSNVMHEHNDVYIRECIEEPESNATSLSSHLPLNIQGLVDSLSRTSLLAAVCPRE